MSLFISNFDRAVSRIYSLAGSRLGLGSYYVWHYFHLFFLFLLVCFLWLRFKKSLGRWRNLTAALIIVFILRVVLFDNPVAYERYSRFIPSSQISYLNAKLAVKNYRQREWLPRKLDYLIVGSSMAQKTLKQFTEFVPASDFLMVYGMRPSEYAFAAKMMSAFDPAGVILYLSLYDLGMIHIDEKLSFFYPFQGLKLAWIYKTIKRLEISKTPGLTVMRNLSGYFFPEYKHAYIFQAYLNQWWSRWVPFLAGAKVDAGVSENSSARQQAALKGINEKNIHKNLLLLEEFIKLCAQKKIKIVVLEGQNNPLGDTPRTRELNGIAMAQLKKLVSRYDHVTFVPISELLPLKAEDYEDMVHVTDEASYRFSKKLFAYFQSHPPFRPARF